MFQSTRARSGAPTSSNRSSPSLPWPASKVSKPRPFRIPFKMVRMARESSTINALTEDLLGGGLVTELRDQLLQAGGHAGQLAGSLLRLPGAGRGALGRGGHAGDV